MGKCKYESHVKPRLAEIEAWARDGVREVDMAKNLGIAASSLSEYKLRFAELAETLVRGKAYVDDVIVTNAYLKRITGYDAVEVKRDYTIKINENGEKEKVLTKVTEQTRHIPGDPRAAEFWLRNRQPEKWNAKREQPEEQEGGVVILPAVAEVPNG